MSQALTLASASPQRRAILAQLGLDFRVEVPEVVEVAGGDPRTMVIENALRKARAVVSERSGASARSHRGARGADALGLVLGADTTVAVDGSAHGKPAGEVEARAGLERLSGREHEVWSGIALIDAGGEATAAACTRVRFRSLSPDEIDWYLATGEWRGRAGGYAVQGRAAALVEAIEGDFWNVVGLPVAELLRLAPGLFGTAAEAADPHARASGP